MHSRIMVMAAAYRLFSLVAEPLLAPSSPYPPPLSVAPPEIRVMIDGTVQDALAETSASFNSYGSTGSITTVKIDGQQAVDVTLAEVSLESPQTGSVNINEILAGSAWTVNIEWFKRAERGKYYVKFQSPITAKMHKSVGSDGITHNYITMIFIGDAHDSRESYAYKSHISLNYNLISVDDISTDVGFTMVVKNETSMTATVYGAILFISDNNNDGLVDFITLQGVFVVL